MHLPDPHTDFVFTLSVESYAVVLVTAALILAAGVLLWIWLR